MHSSSEGSKVNAELTFPLLPRSPIEFQMRLLYENDTVTDSVRLGRKDEILVTVRDALECVLGAMPGLELCVSSGENELHREDELTTTALTI